MSYASPERRPEPSPRRPLVLWHRQQLPTTQQRWQRVAERWFQRWVPPTCPGWAAVRSACTTVWRPPCMLQKWRDIPQCCRQSWQDEVWVSSANWWCCTPFSDISHGCLLQTANNCQPGTVLWFSVNCLHSRNSHIYRFLWGGVSFVMCRWNIACTGPSNPLSQSTF